MKSKYQNVRASVKKWCMSQAIMLFLAWVINKQLRDSLSVTPCMRWICFILWQNYNIRTNLKFGKFVPKNFQKISFLKILENCFQYSTTRHVCPMIEESIMEHTCLPDDRVDQRGISHMSVIKLNSVSFHKLIYLLNTFTLEKIDFAIKV